MKLNAAELLGIAEEVQTFGTKVAAVIKLGEVLGKIGSVVQAADEADARRAKAVAEADAKATIEAASATATGIVSAAKAESAAAGEEVMRAANELAGIEARRDAALAELESTNAKIAQAKAAIAKALA